MMQSYCEIMSQQREQEAILLQEQAVEEKQELLAEEQAANPSEPSPVSYFYNADYDNISTSSTTYTIHLTKSATIITNPSEPTRRIYHNHDIFYDGDDDEELFPDEVKRIQQILERTSFDAITPDFLITDSLSMGDEHLSTILETESDELIKSSVENLVPIPSESEDFSDIEIISDDDSPKKIYSNPLFDEEIISSKIDPHHFNAESDLIESLLNRDISISFHFDRYYDPSSPRPPAKPPNDDGIYFDVEPDTGVFTKVVDDISDNSTRELYVHVPNILPTLPTLSPIFDTLLPFSSENENKVFNSSILASNEEKSHHLLSHRGFKAFQVISDFFESPVMIYGEDIPILDVILSWIFEASRARGFVLRSLELQSLASMGIQYPNLID
ncbi:hypothetical protein Tco_0667857 [Tanacetum coccineum]